MYRSVREWMETPPVSPAVVEQALDLWGTDAPAIEIAEMLGLSGTAELYQLRPLLGWPSRNNYPSGAPRLPVTWSEAELATARRQWERREPAKVIAKTLHLEDRRQVYIVAKREGWPQRRGTANRIELQAVVREVGELSSLERKHILSTVPRSRPTPGLEPDLEPEPKRRKVAVLEFNDLPTDHLARICPGCDGRAIYHPDHAVRLQGPDGEELWHRRCAPRMAA